ncbi:hypothetical protein SERLA73DRAFT_131975 [Serpula lacrymans var. lacrymans S7.3]|uniref:Uncharacterized protein n=1 Tax=Serpula lacrymans var. lacrymans (strain S7.3) TaxID=936435 RepID=F8PQN1_SERL3|nr:hypothetical protein SERLA73DRAFT_131975 [Serpula lacrymans var. lacrymans S7.3]
MAHPKQSPPVSDVLHFFEFVHVPKMHEKKIVIHIEHVPVKSQKKLGSIG